MDRNELLLSAVLLVIILFGLGVKQLGHAPRIEPVVIEGSPVAGTTAASPVRMLSGTPLLSATSSAPPLPAEAIHGQLPDINQATVVDLQRVSGIGPALSRNIIDFRNTNGRFRTMDDLLNVSGIGPSRLQGLKESFAVYFEGVAVHTAVLAEPTTEVQPAAPHDVPMGPVDLNQALSEELEALPGIGPVLARQIIDYRRRQGPFARPEQLMEVAGIGPKRYAAIADRIRVAPAVSSRVPRPEEPVSASGWPSSSTSADKPAKVVDEKGGKVDLNRAGQAQLETLPGIGPVLAGRIIEYRERQGGFQSPEELKNVPGIGEKRYARIRPLIEISW